MPDDQQLSIAFAQIKKANAIIKELNDTVLSQQNLLNECRISLAELQVRVRTAQGLITQFNEGLSADTPQSLDDMKAMLKNIHDLLKT